MRRLYHKASIIKCAYAVVYRSGSSSRDCAHPGGTGGAPAADGAHQLEPSGQPAHHHKVYWGVAGRTAGGAKIGARRSPAPPGDGSEDSEGRILSESALAAKF